MSQKFQFSRRSDNIRLITDSNNKARQVQTKLKDGMRKAGLETNLQQAKEAMNFLLSGNILTDGNATEKHIVNLITQTRNQTT